MRQEGRVNYACRTQKCRYNRPQRRPPSPSRRPNGKHGSDWNADVGDICRNPAPVPAATTPDHPTSWRGESHV